MDTMTEAHGLEKRTILGALRALKRGDFSDQLPTDLEGTDGQIAEAFNDKRFRKEDQRTVAAP